MKIAIKGIGLFGAGASSWSDFDDWRKGQSKSPEKLPTPEIIPKAERRRAPRTAKLAVEVAQQACEMAGQNPGDIASVFTSVLADTEISDQMCRALAQPVKVVSPTRFHNSVHNAPAGYWAIGAGNHAPCTFVSAFRESIGAGLLEAAAQAIAENRPVLLVMYDIPNKLPLSDVLNIDSDFAAAMVIEPTAAEAGTDNAPIEAQVINSILELKLNSAPAEHVKPVSQTLRVAAEENPSAAILTLFEIIAGQSPLTSLWSLTRQSSLEVKLVCD